jgi:hypothetical protein
MDISPRIQCVRVRVRVRGKPVAATRLGTLNAFVILRLGKGFAYRTCSPVMIHVGTLALWFSTADIREPIPRPCNLLLQLRVKVAFLYLSRQFWNRILK